MMVMICEGALDVAGGGVFLVGLYDYITEKTPAGHAVGSSLAGAQKRIWVHMPICNVCDAEFCFEVVSGVS
jgi:hypothetical protein